MSKKSIAENSVCDHCQHFKAFNGTTPAGEPHGECRRYPPVFVPLRNGDGAWTSQFPKVCGHQWCGEWTPLEGDN